MPSASRSASGLPYCPSVTGPSLGRPRRRTHVHDPDDAGRPGPIRLGAEGFLDADRAERVTFAGFGDHHVQSLPLSAAYSTASRTLARTNSAAKVATYSDCRPTARPASAH